MKLRSPLAQLTSALVLLTGTLVLMADLFFGLLPGQGDSRLRVRQQLSEGLAAQLAPLVRHDDTRQLHDTMRALAQRLEGLQSLAVRRADGGVLAATPDHERLWSQDPSRTPASETFRVPLSAEGRPWGQVELSFRGDNRAALVRWLDDPLPRLMLFMALAGGLAYGLYMRRALQHLDPASVIPDRVQRAFDAMAEGVVMIDARGRVLLMNRSFRGLHPDAPAMRAGQLLSAVPWLGAGLAADAQTHPWSRTIESGQASSGDTLEIGHDIGQVRQLVINCAPIADRASSVQGALVTFDDVTKLHHANAALRQAIAETQAAKDEIQRQNVELERLATRDPLTNCLNRRALFAAADPMLARARTGGLHMSCLMLDIDHFKSVNDNHGHAVGDLVIQAVARVLLTSVRPEDLVARYGGEEFCLLLPGLAPDAALGLAERIRARIQAECGPSIAEVGGLIVTASIGCDTRSAQAASAQATIDRADRALYAAKRGGRNRVSSVTD